MGVNTLDSKDWVVMHTDAANTLRQVFRTASRALCEERIERLWEEGGPGDCYLMISHAAVGDDPPAN